MCGIAGYNAAPAWVKTHIDKETQFNILEQSWLHNEHRGRDAAGYFRVDATDLKYYQRKGPGAATNQLKEHWEANGPRAISPSLVFGAHTRQATLGKASDNRNNHPVEYDNVIVTHNGQISNHNKFMNMIPLIKKQQVGKVDSTAIAVALNDVTDPYDMNSIKKSLSGIEGGMAIHAAWKDKPGISLLARSQRSPLAIRFHPDGFFTYGSVDDALYAIINTMGMDPNDPAWKCRELSEFSFVVVEEGTPMRWGTYRDTGWNPSKHILKYKVARIINGNKKKEAYETDSANHWTAKVADRSLATARKAEKTELVFTQKQGFRKSREKVSFPIAATVRPWDKITEADMVYENKEANILYAQYGDIEVVINADNSKLLDVFNHKKNKNMLRHVETRKLPDKDLATFEDWIEKATRATVAKATSSIEPLWSRQKTLPNPTKRAQRIGSGPKIKKAQNLTLISSDGGDNTHGKDWPDPEVINLGMEVTWANLDQYTHSNYAPMGFLTDIKCLEHDMLYSMHRIPDACDQVVLASIAFAASISDVTLWYNLDPNLDIGDRRTKEACPGENANWCQYEPYLHRQVFIGATKTGHDEVVEILVGEMCVKCGSKIFVRSLPEYMEEWTGDKKYVS